jgi:hypothetical protein
MKNDITNHPQKVVADKKEYTLEFNYSSLSELENQTQKGVYQIYDAILDGNRLTLDEMLKLLGCGLLKHHSAGEIEELKSKIICNPGLLMKLKQSAATAFMLTLLPPEILNKTQRNSKKKTK